MFDRLSRYAPAGAVLLLAACAENQPATRPQAYQPQLYYGTAPAWPPGYQPPGYHPSPEYSPPPRYVAPDPVHAPQPAAEPAPRSSPLLSWFAPAAEAAAPEPRPAPPPLRPVDDPPALVPADRSCGWWRLCNFYE
jgi:hypothetical protein